MFLLSSTFISGKKKKKNLLCANIYCQKYVSGTKTIWCSNQHLTLYITNKWFSYFHLNRSVPDLSVASPELPRELPVERIKEPDVPLGRTVFHNMLDYCDLQPKVEIEERCQKGRANGTLLVLLFLNYKNIQGGRSMRKAKKHFMKEKSIKKKNLKSYKTKVHQEK